MAPAEPSSHVPEGKYKVVSLAMDFTGKKFIDEICAIGAFTEPSNVFSQCIMPSRDIAPSATRKHGLRVFTQFGRYRVLRDTMNHGKSLKTKSDYSTLAEFMTWLEGLKGSDGAYDGIILAYHDTTGDNTTHFLLQVIKKFKLMDKWAETVKGYCNLNSVAMAQEDFKGKSMSLPSIAKKLDILKMDDDSFAIAKRRAAMVYKVLAGLLKTKEEEIPSNELLTFCDNQQDVLENLERKRSLAAKIQTLRPIFLPGIRKGARERQRAVQLRKHLIDNEVDMDMLTSAFKDGGKAEIAKIVENTKASRRKKDAEELLQMVVDYFTKAETEAKDKKQNGEVGGGESATKVDKDRHHSHHEDSETEEDEDDFQEAKDGEGDSSNSNSDHAEK